MKGFPKRGEVWLVNWNPARGSEQAGRRPALVIQNDIGNEKAPTTIVAAISSSVKVYPMNVQINPPEGGLDHPSIIKTSRILTVSNERLDKRLGRVSGERLNAVDGAIKFSPALSQRKKKIYQIPASFAAGFQIISVLRRGTARLNWYLGYPITRATSTRRLSGNPKRLLSCPLFSRAYIK